MGISIFGPTILGLTTGEGNMVGSLIYVITLLPPLYKTIETERTIGL
jgi:hypothetical protein